MFSAITSGALFGISSYLVRVEVDIAQGLPGFSLVGFPGSEVREAGERVRVAIRNSGIKMPPMHITVNLSPAGMKKEGTAFDLPMAVGILTSMGYIRGFKEKKVLLIGELGLDGEVKAVKGVLPVVIKAIEEGLDWCVVPKGNEREGAVIGGIKIRGVESLKEVMEWLNGGMQEDGGKQKNERLQEHHRENFEEQKDYAQVNGQKAAKRAVEVAAAGFHHLLLAGPPGAGKTMIASRIPSILPPMTKEEILEITSIYSVAGMLDSKQVVITSRPFVSPHHTVTEKAMAGGGLVPRPGLVSLAHRGVLFLDEMTEFKRPVLEILRQPLEDKKIYIARQNGSYVYPADFIMAGAMNPCPCGYFPDLRRCSCSPAQIKRYIAKVSGPILDRIDIGIELTAVSLKDMADYRYNESSEMIRKRVLQARNRQTQRYRGTGILFNANLSPEGIKKYCILGQREKILMEKISQLPGVSARAYFKILKIAQTIADLAGEEKINESHLAEAAAYRQAGTLAGGIKS